MLQPRKQKHRKEHRLRGSFAGNSHTGNALSFGTYGLKALGTAEVTSRQIESARRVITRYTKRGGKIWIPVFPHKPITKKGAEVPMGSGKGAPDRFVVMVKPGRVLFEMDGIEEDMAKEALRLAAYKLPIKCKVISKK
ncbi:50S ribosomal protein L16 [Candidatus Peregrinibacteria bacterium]|jgi:large subunit ribosomal protein L16|nr:50S ribosomal protein L16 [Candidatus Peregrinibacteria bacterium]MBT4055673.1 50S ribosomal protein L16 [Candidatus Peregrinibacteria bacterium]